MSSIDQRNKKMAKCVGSNDNAGVRQCILSSLASVPDPWIRPNKLRKIVCQKKEDGSISIDWTQFQNSLDGLVQEDIVKTRNNDDGQLLIIVPKRENNSGEVAEEKKKKNDETSKHLTIKIPLGIALHLSRKGGKKKHNIENNTKTKLIVGRRNNISDDSTELSIHCYSDKAERRLNTAMTIISAMLKAYKENPDHFVHQKGGGTLEEQKKMKAIKLEREMITSSKRGKTTKEDKTFEKLVQHKRKKARKYY